MAVVIRNPRPDHEGISADGLAAKFYVRGGLHPFYGQEDMARATSRFIMRGRLAGTASLSIEERSLVAAQHLAGWVTRPAAERPADRVVWHRYMAGVRVSVGEATS